MMAEQLFSELMRQENMTCEFIDDWYDFLVGNLHKIEVKSCRLTIKDDSIKKETRFRVGRFDFENPDNFQRLKSENGWVFFIIRHSDQLLPLGFTKAKDLHIKRYISIHQTRNLIIHSVNDWLNMVGGCNVQEEGIQ